MDVDGIETTFSSVSTSSTSAFDGSSVRENNPNGQEFHENKNDQQHQNGHGNAAPSSMFSHYMPLNQCQRGRSNSTSSIWSAFTVQDADLSKLLLGVATMVHCQMVGNIEVPQEIQDRFDYFSETTFYDAKESDLQQTFPSVGDVLEFYSNCYRIADFRSESAVIMLVYVNRLMGMEVPLTMHNWKPITITALLLAQKLWDDTPLINADFCVLYPALSPKRINFLERAYLNLLGFKLAVPLSLYAQYYYELISVAEETVPKRVDPEYIEEERKTRVHSSKIYARGDTKNKAPTTEMLVHRKKRIVMPL